MWKYLEGIGITTFFYLLVLMLGYFIDSRFLGYKMVVSAAFVGSLVMIIPYVFLGLFSNIIFENDNQIKIAFVIGLIAVVAERLAIYLIGFTFILRDVGPYEPTWIGLPYFTPLYIYFGGFISLVLCTLPAWISSKMLKSKKV
jgi:small-conductance mechanosensitive channel